jgi:hypothetical protein
MKDSSLPVASFVWSIENLHDEPAEVSLMFTWECGSGISIKLFFITNFLFALIATQEFLCRDISHESIDISDDGISASGVSIKQTLRDMKLEYCIMGKKEVCNKLSYFVRVLILFKNSSQTIRSQHEQILILIRKLRDVTSGSI